MIESHENNHVVTFQGFEEANLIRPLIVKFKSNKHIG